jgi:hypothetical protein
MNSLGTCVYAALGGKCSNGRVKMDALGTCSYAAEGGKCSNGRVRMDAPGMKTRVQMLQKKDI